MASRSVGGLKRRRFLAGAAASLALLAPGCTTPPTRQSLRIGAFTGETSKAGTPPVELDIMEGLRAEGFVQGETMTIEWQHTEGDPEKYAEIANSLVAHGSQLIIASSSRAAVAAKAATRTIPIVMQGVADPLEWGVVDSYAHPGGNITGTAFDNTAEAIKRVELFHDAFPEIRRVVVVGIYSTTATSRVADLSRAADSLGLDLTVPFTDDADGLTRALESARGAGIVVGGSVALDVAQVIEYAATNRIPAIFARPENVTAGGLMSYGGNRRELRLAVGTFVRQIVAGAAPGDLPVQIPMQWDFYLNTSVAERAGFRLPRDVMLRVDVVVQ